MEIQPLRNHHFPFGSGSGSACNGVVPTSGALRVFCRGPLRPARPGRRLGVMRARLWPRERVSAGLTQNVDWVSCAGAYGRVSRCRQV